MKSRLSTYKEQGLLKRVALGDESAFASLFNLYKHKVYALGISLTRSEFLAEEITQEVFMKLWVNRETLSDVVYFNAYLRTIARNLAFNYLKRIACERMVLNRIMQKDTGVDQSTESDIVYNDYHKLLLEAIKNLSPQVKKVYILCRYEGLKQKEIARRMDISYYTVKEYMKKAHSVLAEYLDEHLE